MAADYSTHKKAPTKLHRILTCSSSGPDMFGVNLTQQFQKIVPKQSDINQCDNDR